MGFIKKNEQKKEETDSMENKEYSFSEEAELKACRYCQTMVPKTTKVCPNCRKRLRKNWSGILVLLCLLAACAAGAYYYMAVYSVTEQVSSAEAVAEAVAETGQNMEDGGVPEGGLTLDEESGPSESELPMEGLTTDGLLEESAEEAADAETAMQVEDLPALPMGIEDAAASKTEVNGTSEEEQDSADGKEDEPEKEDETEKEDEAEKEDTAETKSRTGQEDGAEEGAEAEAKSGTGQEDRIMNEGEADKEDESEKEAEADKEDELQVKFEPEKNEEADDALKSDADSLDETVEVIDISAYTEEEFRDMCGRINYKKLLRSQELYLNAAVTEALTVVEQVDGGLFDENIYYLCEREDEQGITRYYIIRDDREEDDTPILAGDVIQVYGQLFGSCKLPGYLVKTQPVVPALTMVYYDFLEE